MTTVELQPPWTYAVRKDVTSVLVDIEEGLTGMEIGDPLLRLKMDDPAPGAIKRNRLTKPFVARESEEQSPKRIVTFLVAVMGAVRSRDRLDMVTRCHNGLNERLAFVGLYVMAAGRVVRGACAQIRVQASGIATSIAGESQRRRAHPKVLKDRSVWVLKQTKFRACGKTTKSIFKHLRSLTGASGDGASLVRSALSLGVVARQRRLADWYGADGSAGNGLNGSTSTRRCKTLPSGREGGGEKRCVFLR
jgi:hypothetical protein